MPATDFQPSFTTTEQLLGRGIALSLWVFSAAVLASLAAWTGQPPAWV